MNPKISVIIPIFGTEEYLDKCIKSVINQTFKDIEIICVDDCSPDNSYKIVEKYIEQDNRISLIRHEKNLGLGGARNTAIRVAKADYIASVDSDDCMLPNMLEELWDATDNGWFDVVCCGFDKVNEEGEQLSNHIYLAQVIENKENDINIFSIMNPAFWNKLWRRSLFVDNDIFFLNYVYFEDMSTTPRILAKAEKIKILDSSLYHYLVRNHSITHSFSSKHIIDYLKGFETIVEFLKRNSILVRYKMEFKAYVDSVIRFYAHKVSESDMPEKDMKQYLRHLLILKIAFFELHDLIEPLNKKRLVSLLETASSKGDLL